MNNTMIKMEISYNSNEHNALTYNIVEDWNEGVELGSTSQQKEQTKTTQSIPERDPLDEFPGSKAITNKYCQSLLILGIKSEDDKTKAYFALAKKWHPDKWSTASKADQKYAESVFKVVEDAYTYLK